MQEVLDFFRKLFDVSDWPPRWHCGNWTDFHGWLYIISDLLIWSAYFAIPLVILRYITRRSNMRFVRGYILFAAFILACGSTHFLDALTFWFPAYRLNALVRFITGVVSWVTVFYLIRILPIANKLRSYEELEKEIRERERVEAELKQLNEHLIMAQEIANVGHWEWDVLNNKLTWSEQLFKIYGVEPTATLGYDDFIDRVHPEDKDMVNSHIHKAFQSGQFSSFIHRIIVNGEVKVLHARGEAIRNEEGQIIRMLGTGQDITEQQKAEQQLTERTRELEITNAELQKFAYVASHDLQEPLRKILTFGSLLGQEINAEDEKAQLYLSKIVQASGRMQKLIDDILQFSSIKADAADFERLDLNKIFNEVMSDMEVQMSASRASVQMEKLGSIEGIESQIGQLFQNLLSNAIKFSKENQPPVLSVTQKKLTGKEVSALVAAHQRAALEKILHWEREPFIRIDFKDHGIGFDETYSSKIFEIFQRLHHQQYAGTGIGLAICKKIVDSHHGFIIASSKPGNGACFSVILPVSQKKFTRQDNS